MESNKQQQQTTAEEKDLGRLIYLTSQELRNFAEKILSPHDLTVEQYHLLTNISRHSGMSQNQLCRCVGKKPANTTRILDRLEKKSWIERRMHPRDRRASMVFLTLEGESIVARVSRKFEAYSSRFIAGIDSREEEIFRQVIAKINTNLNNLISE